MLSTSSSGSAVLCLIVQLCLTVCDPMNCSHQPPMCMGILQARILEWVTMPSSRRSSWLRDRTRLLCPLHWQAGSLPLRHLEPSHMHDFIQMGQSVCWIFFSVHCIFLLFLFACWFYPSSFLSHFIIISSDLDNACEDPHSFSHFFFYKMWLFSTYSSAGCFAWRTTLHKMPLS